VGDIVFEVPAAFDGTITIKFASTSEPAASAGSSDKGWSSQVDGILDRFAKYDQGHDHVAMAEYMRDLGFVAIGPKAKDGSGESDKPYIRWEYKGVRKITLYQLSPGLVSDSKRQLAFALTVEGGVHKAGGHPRVESYYDNSSVETVRAAAKSFLAYADKA